MTVNLTQTDPANSLPGHCTHTGPGTPQKKWVAKGQGKSSKWLGAPSARPSSSCTHLHHVRIHNRDFACDVHNLETVEEGQVVNLAEEILPAPCFFLLLYIGRCTTRTRVSSTFAKFDLRLRPKIQHDPTGPTDDGLTCGR